MQRECLKKQPNVLHLNPSNLLARSTSNLAKRR
nr:MAG TPA: hypothetical protein [Caudoviricetes sp.]